MILCSSNYIIQDIFQWTFLHFWIASQDFVSDIWNFDNNPARAILLYFLLHFNYDIKQKETSSDSTQSRDQQIDLEAYQQILLESLAPE